MPEPFRYDADYHEYIVGTGEVLPHITGMLERTGWVDDTWMTEESSERGQAVHDLTKTYDLGALHLATCASRHRGYLLAHVAASRALRPAWTAIEEPHVHYGYRFGGRPDRVGKALQQQTVLEVKTAAPSRAHQIQTALQAILVSDLYPLPPEHWLRLTLYLKATGRFKLEQHNHRADFDEAYRIIKVCAA
jgi:hypothetical protein